MKLGAAGTIIVLLGVVSVSLNMMPAFTPPPAPAARSPGPAADPCSERFHAPRAGLEAESRAVFSGTSDRTVRSVTSSDGHAVPITVFRPAEANAQRPVPVLLQSHGWAGTRMDSPSDAAPYVRAGFGVVGIDMRGHGEARTSSQARVHHMDFEIQDVRAVISFIATLDWVVKDGEDDPLIGALGGSYGGGYQLLTAAIEPRLDAIAPDITWNDLVQSLAPNGAPKSAWIDILYGGGVARANLHPTIHQAFSIVQSQNRVPDGSIGGEPDIRAQFLRSSPRSYPGAIGIPTLLTQGVNDTLFNFNEAAHNYERISAQCASTYLVTHLGGHLIPSLQAGPGGSPCGPLRDLYIRFYQRHLLALPVDVGSRVCLALEDGTVVRAETYPIPSTRMRNVTLDQTVTIVPGSAQRVSIPLLTPERDTILAGVPTLGLNLTNPSPDTIVYVQLAATGGAGTRILNWQVTPLRATAPAQGLHMEVELGGVGATLRQGERLELVLSGTSDQFAHNSERIAGVADLSGIVVRLPVVG